MSSNVKVISLLCILLFFPRVLCHTMEDAKRLLSDKLSNYEKTFRPIANQSAHLVLYTAFELVSIQEFDEVQEKLTVTGVVALVWIDEFMKWNPNDYGGLTQLLIESDKVWTPNLVLTNNVDKIEKVGDAWQVIRILPDGTSLYYPGDVFSASCKVDVTYYPWDRHKCAFSFNIWAHFKNEIQVFPSNDKVQTSYFSENGAWIFADSSVKIFSDNTGLEFYLHLERKPRFVLVNVILPIIFMAYLNTLIFLIPAESGERISYSITVLLALTVFLTLVGDNLPKTSSPMSIFSYYLLTVLVVSITITLATIFNLRIFYTDDSKPADGCFKSLYRCMKCSCRGKRYNKKHRHQRNYSNKIKNKIYSHINMQQTGAFSDNLRDVTTGYKGTLLSVSRNIYLPDRQWRGNSTEEEMDDIRSEHGTHFDGDTDVSWKDVSVTFDKIFFALSIIILTIATTLLFLMLLLGDRS